MGRSAGIAVAIVLIANLQLTEDAGAQRLKLREFKLPPGTPSWIATGPDRNLWFTSDAPGNYIGRLTPRGTLATFSIPTPASGADHITTGPDGNLWFTERDANKIGRITPQGAISEFAVPTAGAQPRGITRGPDGALWFTEFGGDKIGRISTSGRVSEFGTGLGPGTNLVSITRGPDGNVWFTAAERDMIGRMTPAGAFTGFPVSNASSPEELTVGPDRNLWFTEDDGDRVGRITPKGRVTEFQTGITPGATPSRIVAGPDRALWFTELIGGRIARLTTSGRIDEFPVGRDSKPWGITAGPDGAIWFAKAGTNRIARFRPPLLPAVGAQLRWSFVGRGAGVEVAKLTVSEIPRGAKVELRCRGGGCPRREVIRRPGKTVSLARSFRRPLRVGARIDVRISLPGLSTLVRRFTVRAGSQVRDQVLCQPPGRKRPVRGCR